MADGQTPLVKKAGIVLLDSPYDLAKNGEHFHLVDCASRDAYGNPIARKVSVAGELCHGDTVQGLIDLLGDAYTKIFALDEEISRAHVALQRESEPLSHSRRPSGLSTREGAGSVASLEGEK